MVVRPIGAIKNGSPVSSTRTAASITVIRPEPPITAAIPSTANVPGSGIAQSNSSQRYVPDQ